MFKMFKMIKMTASPIFHLKDEIKTNKKSDLFRSLGFDRPNPLILNLNQIAQSRATAKASSRNQKRTSERSGR